MQTKNIILSRILSSALALFSTLSSANIPPPVILGLSFDQYSIPHATFIINNEPIYAMIDTGSTFGFHLDESNINKIENLKEGKEYFSTDGTGKIQQNITYLANSLNMNGIKLENVTITPFKQWGMMLSGQGKLPDNPVAGLGAFKGKQILLDYKSKLLTITENVNYKESLKDNFSEFYFHLSSDGLVFDVEQSGSVYHLILDTGATVSMVWRERLKSHQTTSCLKVNPEMDNKGCEATMFLIKSKDENFQHFSAVVVSGDFQHMGTIDGLIGNNFIANKKIILDFKNNRVFISNDDRKR